LIEKTVSKKVFSVICLQEHMFNRLRHSYNYVSSWSIGWYSWQL